MAGFTTSAECAVQLDTRFAVDRAVALRFDALRIGRAGEIVDWFAGLGGGGGGVRNLEMPIVPIEVEVIAFDVARLRMRLSWRVST